MTDLMHTLVEHGKPVVSFPIREYWLDIGEHASYLQAQRDTSSGVVGTPGEPM